MKTVKHEIKLERSVKIILAVFAVGIFLNAFTTPIAQELFGIKSVSAELRSLVMFYSDIPVGPVYVKLGVQRAEVVIEESLNGTTYEDETLLGYTVGLGYRGSIGDAFYKAELATW